MISSELPEILGMSDRILVMREGRIAGEVTHAEATEERVMSYAAGVLA
jgi:ABC-type sugar transport system ATPase subunit